MTDMKAQWSQFHLGTIAVITPKTVITENPVGPEADALRQYAKNAPLQTVAILQNMTTSIPDRKLHLCRTMCNNNEVATRIIC